MKYTVTQEPTSLVVPLAEAKEALGIIHDLKNQTILALSAAAEDFMEKATGRYFLDHTIEAYFDSFDTITITHRPNLLVQSLSYYDSDNVLHELPYEYASYSADSVGLDTVIRYDDAPALYDRSNPIIVAYVVGYGEAADVPELLKYGIKGLMRHWFMQSSPVVVGTIASELPLHVNSIIDLYKVVNV